MKLIDSIIIFSLIGVVYSALLNEISGDTYKVILLSLFTLFVITYIINYVIFNNRMRYKYLYFSNIVINTITYLLFIIIVILVFREDIYVFLTISLSVSIIYKMQDLRIKEIKYKKLESEIKNEKIDE